MTTPLALSLDGPGWSLYHLEPGEALARRAWEAAPAGVETLPAVVPGHVQNALLKAGTLPHPYEGLNSRQWTWTGERDWVYERTIPGPPDTAGMRFHLRFEALDGRAHVFLNGERVGEHHARFVPVEWDVTPLLRPGVENRLTVIIEAYREPDDTLEGQVQRWWGGTFHHPDFKLLGIPGSVTLKATGPARMLSISPYTNISLDQTEAALSLVVEFDAVRNVPAIIRTEITQEGLPVTTVEDPITVRPDTSLVQSFTIQRIQLWWPNGHGRQPLYEARVSLLDRNEDLLDLQTFRFGVRHLEQVPCEGAPPGSLPYCIRVNGEPIWIKGWIWVPPDYLWGAVSKAKYERLLRLAKDANVNLLRVWGGGTVERETFYRLCDRLGILVWQDFPLFGGPGPDPQPLPSGPRLAASLRAHAEGVVAARRVHASLARWTGGAWLVDPDGSTLGSDHPVLAELHDVVQTEDSQRLWLPACFEGPAGQMEQIGYCAPSLPEKNPPAPGPDPVSSLEISHDGPEWGSASRRFGTAATPLQAARAEQWFQAHVLGCAAEDNRRRVPTNAGVLIWRADDPCPSSASFAVIEHSGETRPAVYALKRAFAPFHVSAQAGFEWAEQVQFRADVWLHNDGPERSLLNVVATVVDLHGRELYQENLSCEAPEHASENVGDLSWRFPADFREPFLLLLEVIDEEGECLARNHYWHSRAPEPAFQPFLHAPVTTLEVQRTEWGLRIRNSGPAVALAVEVEAGEALVEDSHFPLVPGAEREVRLSDPYAPVRVTAWNAAETTA